MGLKPSPVLCSGCSKLCYGEKYLENFFFWLGFEKMVFVLHGVIGHRFSTFKVI